MGGWADISSEILRYFVVAVQNGSLHQKDTVHDNDFEPYLPGQSNQVSTLDQVW